MPDSTLRPGPDEEWNELLRQLRQQAAAQPPPFFYARVRTRLGPRATAARFRLPHWLRRPAYAAMLGALILAVSGDGAAPPSPNGRPPAYPVRYALP